MNQRIKKSTNPQIGKSVSQRTNDVPHAFLLPCSFAPLLPILFLAAATLLFFWPIWLLSYRFPQGGGDLWGQLHPIWTYVASWLRRGVFPLWSTQMMAGDPILSEQQYGLFNPINWPLFLFPSVPPTLVSLRGMFSIWLAGAGMYLYLHHSPVWRIASSRRLNRSAALIGALAYMFNDSFIIHLGHPQFNDTMAWLPWTLLGVDYAMRNARAIPLAGMALGLLLLAGHGQAALYAATFIGIYSLWQIGEAIRSKEAREQGDKGAYRCVDFQKSLRRMGRLLLVPLFAACIAAPALIPGLERLPRTVRAIRTEGGIPEYEFHPEMLLDLVTPYIHGRGMRGYWPSWQRVESAYVGVVALALAGLGILTHLRQRRTGFLILTATLVYLFALGSQGPLYPIVNKLPFFSATWKTARVIYLLSFILAIAAALGAVTVLDMQESRGARWQGSKEAEKRESRIGIIVYIGAMSVIALLMMWCAPDWVATTIPPTNQSIALAGLRFAALTLLTITFLIFLRMRLYIPHSSFSMCHSLSHTNKLESLFYVQNAGLILLLLTELIATGALADVEKLPRATENPHLAAIDYLQADTGWFRIDVDSKARGLWSPSAVMVAGFEVPQGTGNPMELVVYTQFYWAIPYKGASVYQLLSAKYIIVPKDALPGGEGIWPVFKEDPLIDIHLNTNAQNRVWLVYHTQPVNTLEDAYAIIFDETFDPAQTATVQNGPALNFEGQGTLEVYRYTPNHVSFFVRTSAPALFILSDLNYPGWTARLDDNLVPIFTTNGLFRGVYIPEGEHHVEMRFFPPSLRVGLGLFIIAILTVIMGARIYQRRRRTKDTK
ncbi:MAG: YfhO family protein [Anaerolineae bacterium]|nr:YfhO family protein [Anaerolineae bacterium]